MESSLQTRGPVLWLAIQFPRFCLDVHTRGVPGAVPMAVVEGAEGRQRIHALNRLALDQGLYEGMGLASAWALLPEAQILRRQKSLEQQALLGLAEWAGQFSAQISLDGGQRLLVEVGASLKLFGGLEKLLQAVRSGLQQSGYCADLAVAPTPMAAAWLALAGMDVQILDKSELRSALSKLPLQVAAFPGSVSEALLGMGVRCIGDIFNLPRKAFTRRLGQAVTARLDRALGQLPDPRPWHRPAPVFERRLLLPAGLLEQEALLFPLQLLLDELSAYLRANDTGLQELSVFMVHADNSETCLSLGLLRCSRDRQHLLDLCRDRLERIELPAPVEEMRLYADCFEALAPEADDLFGPASQPAPDWRPLLERIVARLGANKVFGLREVDQHRPELAWQPAPPAQAPPGLGMAHRPVWLLAEPKPLPIRDGRPCMGEPLQLLQGPERIETGWWDGRDLSRDYYRARGGDGTCVWVYRERQPPRGWFLHGLFG